MCLISDVLSILPFVAATYFLAEIFIGFEFFA
jgi:hypothetical protein